MRKSLGMDLNTSIEEAMERYWTWEISYFLRQKKGKQRYKETRKLLSKYKKKVVSNFNAKLKNKENENLYNKIKKN